MLPRRYDNILAFRYEDGTTLAFHGHNLEVARVDAKVWDALELPLEKSSPAEHQEIWSEIQLWNSQVAQESQDAPPSQMRGLSLHVAQICNMRCTYCAAGGDGTYGAKAKKLDIGDVLPHLTRMLNNTPRGESFQLNFLGGEPLIYPDLIEEIIRYAVLITAGRDIRLLYRVVTNGTPINERTLQLLTQNNFEIMVSVDGPSEINDRVRPMATRKGSTQIVQAGLEKLIAVRSQLRALKTNSVFGRHNMDLLSTYEFLRQYSPDQMTFTFSVEDEDDELGRQFAQQLEKVAERAFALGGELELRRIDVFDNLFERLDRQVRLHNLCGAGKSFLLLDTEKNVHVCNWFANDPEERVGYQEEIYQDQLQRYSRSLIELNNCHSCWAKHLCGGGCMYVNKLKMGDKHVSDPSFCLRQRLILKTGIYFYEKSRSQQN